MTPPQLKLVDKGDMDKQKALDAALGQIERAFGKGSIMKLGQAGSVQEIEAVSSGSLSLDIALGIGGLPRGRIVEIYGPESAGKTTMALHATAEAQRAGGICAFVDAEHALDPVYAKKLGVNLDELLISQPDAGEQALEIADTAGPVRCRRCAGHRQVSRRWCRGRSWKATWGQPCRPAGAVDEPGPAQAHLVDSKSRCMVIFINQIRQKIGVMFGSPRPPPAATP